MDQLNLKETAIEFLQRRTGIVVTVGFVFTLVLTLPMILMAPTEVASPDPPGEAFDLQKDINDRFATPIHGIFFLVESRDGDVLTQPVLWEIYQNSIALLDADNSEELAVGNLPSQSYLYTFYDPETNSRTVGVFGSMALAVESALREVGLSLENASDTQVKIAIDRVLAKSETRTLTEALGQKAKSEKRMILGQEINYWTSPAMVFSVAADNHKLGGGTLTIGVSGGDVTLNKEKFNRKVQNLLRGSEETYSLWGIAIDANLEGIDEGKIAGTFIMFTVITAVLVVGVVLRSYWAMVLTGSGLGVLIIWLKGLSALVGIKGGMVIDLIVPIAMISLGVDFAVHAIRRYQEEKSIGYHPDRALRIGLTGVCGALVLAMLSDGIAFLSNISSGIEAVIHFGIAAAIAVLSSFLVLGIVVPISLARIDAINIVGSPRPKVQIIKAAIGICAAVVFGTAIVVMVAVRAELGFAVWLFATIVFIVLPVIIFSRRSGIKTEIDGKAEAKVLGMYSFRSFSIDPIVTRLARYSWIVIFSSILITGISVWTAMKLEAELDAKDFLDAGSDFVVGLDKLDEYIGERGGEPGLVYVKGDLTDVEALKTIEDFISHLTENSRIARNSQGNVFTGTHALSIVKSVTSNEFAMEAIGDAVGQPITDEDGDGIPDSNRQIKLVYDYVYEHGVPLDSEILRYNPDQVKTALFHDPTGVEENVTVLIVGIVGSREQANVEMAAEQLDDDLDRLRTGRGITKVGLTGSPFNRVAQMTASTESLQRSLPIAATASFVLLLIAIRSFKYALVTIIPIGLVVAWLYGLMYVFGFALNFITATIGAVSVGVGIDYSIHMTERFREELKRSSDKFDALSRSAKGTGVALFGSATSSIVGFAIMGLAPMPLFAAYGRLTAVMIFLALAAALLVLPSLLMLVTSAKDVHGESAE